ncbi:osmotically-inducible lipoprotein OsmB [Klebsiella michiganensis]|uniref:osmotically-inducible lipoprotein OsmB n=1 Tax=Klebsiella michiganensis TaxID=1134687 RepID=UPI0039C21D5A
MNMMISYQELVRTFPNWSKRDRNTAIGAGAGALGGAVLTDGSTLGTLGGAAVGGIIGHQVGK